MLNVTIINGSELVTLNVLLIINLIKIYNENVLLRVN